MAEYVASSFHIQASEQTDLTSPYFTASEDCTITGTLRVSRIPCQATVAPGSPQVELSAFAAIKWVYIKNDGLVTVTAAYTDSGAASQQTIPAGEWIKLTDVTVAGDITLSVAAVVTNCIVYVCGT